MKPNRPNTTRSALWILAAPALALPATAAFVFAGAGTDWIRAAWLASVVWMFAASLVQALWRGLRHRDWSAFNCEAFPPDDERFDFETRTGRYAYRRIQARDEALLRDGGPAEDSASVQCIPLQGSLSCE